MVLLVARLKQRNASAACVFRNIHIFFFGRAEIGLDEIP